MNSTYINQELLLSQLKQIFPKEDPIVEVRKQAKLKYPSSDSYLEIDIWLPKLNVGFEFQDTYHYITTWYSQRTKDDIRWNDTAKAGMAQRAGISLIIVPCWWDGDVESLATTIAFERPDLISLMEQNSNFATKEKRLKAPLVPISLNPKSGFFQDEGTPDVGELMLASFPLNSSTEFVDSNSWWMGEKYDGVRFCWNPKHSIVYTRRGRELELQQSTLNSFPREFVDGEFWFGRGSFSLTFMLCKGSVYFVHWDTIRALSFDAPAPKLRDIPFEERYKQLIDAVETNHPFIIVAPRIECEGSEHLNKVVGCIIESGGEGTILRLVGSRYISGRSHSLIKFKAANADKEGLVIGVEAGYVTLKLPNGQIFEVSPQNVHIPTPSKGEVVTFSYEINSRRELPLNPIIFRKRNDVEWEELVKSDSNEQMNFLINNEQAQTKIYTEKPQGFWTHANMRIFLENLANSFHLDPLKSETWLNHIPFKAVYQTKGGRLIVNKFGGLTAALKALFPEVDLENSESHYLWSSIENRRRFFENYAKVNGFDSHNPEHWYSQRPQSILSEKSASRVMFYHGHSVSRALLDLFPDIGLDKSRLGKWSWQYSANRKQFFENHASENEFDPLVAENWYRQSRGEIMSSAAATFVVSYHCNLLAQSLIDLFPDVAFDGLKLLCNFDYHLVVNAIKFLEDQEVDTITPESWRKQAVKNLAILEGARKILNRYKNTSPVTLLEQFPDTDNIVVRTKTRIYPEKSEKIEKTEEMGHETQLSEEIASEKGDFEYAKLFFVSYARQNGFDPLVPENWYSQFRTKIIATTGSNKALAKFKGSVSKALFAVFPDIGLDQSKLWTSLWSDLKVQRIFFEAYAKRTGFDPIIPQNWYSVDIEHIVSTKGFLDIISYYNHSLAQALVTLFPEISFEKSKLPLYSVWNDPKARRKYFENYANENAFDPLDAKSWLSHPQEKILAAKGAVKVLSYHEGRVSKALLDLFPEIGLRKSSFWSYHFQLPQNRREFFLDYARSHGFDALNPKNWYTHKEKLAHAKGIKSVLHYSNSIAEALAEAFPTISLDESLFRTSTTSPDKESRRKVFLDYARTKGFDPRSAESWYLQPPNSISSMQRGGLLTMIYYKGNLQKALLDLFPDIGLDSSKFCVNEEIQLRQLKV